MTSNTVRFLLKKLDKDTLIKIIIKSYETVFKGDPDGLKEAYHQMAIIIQAYSILSGSSSLEDFYEPFKSELKTYLDTLHPKEIEDV